MLGMPAYCSIHTVKYGLQSLKTHYDLTKGGMVRILIVNTIMVRGLLDL